MDAPRQPRLALVATSAHPDLATGVARALGIPLARCKVDRFPDGEIHVELVDLVRDADVFLLGPTCRPVADHLLELTLLSDAARRAGAARITAVVPYFAYARQDRRASGRESIAARVVADVLVSSGIGRVVAVDLHDPAIEGFFSVPVEHLTAVPLLAAALKGSLEAEVIVAPDIGAAKLAERYADALDLPVAVVHKSRLGPTHVRVRRLVGAVSGKSALVVDDMISTGGTVEAACEALLHAGATGPFTLAATHGLFVADCAERLARFAWRRVLATDSVPAADASGLAIERVGLASLLATAIDRLHAGASLAELRART
jgi:ribose-phosphate pyrophosphokinase